MSWRAGRRAGRREIDGSEIVACEQNSTAREVALWIHETY
jgi:hypothetical protein